MRLSSYRPLLLSSGVLAASARTPGKTALLCAGQKRSYEELAYRLSSACGAAQKFGIRKGDRVAIVAPNCIEYVEIVLGLADAGAIVATINPRSTAAELNAACEDCGARLLFVHSSLTAIVSAKPPSCVQRRIILGEEYAAWLSESQPAAAIDGLNEDDPFTLVYSSGTTGEPKGVLISHRSRALTFHGMAMEYGCYGPDDRQLGIAPLAHGAGFAFIMATLFFGGTCEILPKFDPELILRCLARENFTGVFMVPTHFQAIFDLDARTLSRFAGQAKSLRTIMSNAAALPYALKQKIIAYWGEGRLHEAYGSTEASIVTNLRPQHQLAKKHCVGPAFALNRIRLLNAQGREVLRGEVGELYASSPYLFNGYWNQPQLTAQNQRDGWVSAGDLARADEDGFIYIVDRKSDVVISGGINIYPREIEAVLLQHPAVADAAVIGVADNYWGEALRAFVVLRPGMNTAVNELTTHCRDKLSGYKVPKEFRFMPQLPRNVGGKLLKRELRDLDLGTA